MSVFISYRHTDRKTAIQIANEFNTKNVEYYLDVIDDESRNTEDITEVITKNIKNCSHLLAIISPTTSGSWWVPFEIGQATVSNRRICSYAVSNSTLDLSRISFRSLSNFLPEYLRKWPVLVSKIDLDKFIEQYKQDTQHYTYESFDNRRNKNESFGRSELTKSSADAFHEALKMQL